MTRPIVFLTDYGLADEFVGVCHGVIARIAPEAQVIDLTHQVARQDVLKGAIVLTRAVGFMPDDAVFLAVVDPGVGSYFINLLLIKNPHRIDRIPNILVIRKLNRLY